MNRTRVPAPTVILVAIAFSALGSISAHASPYADFLQPANPEHFGLTMFSAGFGSDNKYGATHEGFQFEQSVTPYVGLVGRVAAYQVWQGAGFDTPWPDEGKNGPRNFGVFEGGVDLAPLQGTSLIVMGGHDLGDADGPRIEGYFSSWLVLHSRHPTNFSFSGSHYYQNGLTAGTFDLRTVLRSTRELTWMAGVGGAVWDEGPEPHFMQEEGLDLGAFVRRWGASIDVQVGYGSLHLYGELGISRRFGWDE